MLAPSSEEELSWRTTSWPSTRQKWRKPGTTLSTIKERIVSSVLSYSSEDPEWSTAPLVIPAPLSGRIRRVLQSATVNGCRPAIHHGYQILICWWTTRAPSVWMTTISLSYIFYKVWKFAGINKKLDYYLTIILFVKNAMLMVGTILGPCTIFFMIIGSFNVALGMDNWATFLLRLIPIIS